MQVSNVFEVIEPGLHTTVQDLGRTGFQRYGVGPSGVMDDYSFRIGNILVGNEQGDAGLEITMVGPSLRVLNDTVIAITGAHLSPSIDHTPIPMWKSIFVEKGQEISFGKPCSGARAYLTVAGGVQVPEIMGSKSTNVKSKFGGVEGRGIAENDVLSTEVLSNSEFYIRKGRILSPRDVPTFNDREKIRVIPGPQEWMFTDGSIKDFYEAPFKITPQSDRMGYRLNGEKKLVLTDQLEMVTDAVTNGSIQVPRDGAPILLMADRQTSGGYPKIANVITVDLYKVAQRLPGQILFFEKVTLDEAHEEIRQRETFLKKLQMGAHILMKN